MANAKGFKDELRQFGRRFLNVRTSRKGKGKKAGKFIEVIKKRGNEPEEKVKEAMPTPAEVKEMEKSSKPMAGKFHRITPKFHKLT